MHRRLLVPLIPALVLPVLQVQSCELPVLRVSILAISILRIPSPAYPSGIADRKCPTNACVSPCPFALRNPFSIQPNNALSRTCPLALSKIVRVQRLQSMLAFSIFPPNTHDHPHIAIAIAPSLVPSRFRIRQRPRLASYLAEHFTNRAERWYNGMALLFQASAEQLS